MNSKASLPTQVLSQHSSSKRTKKLDWKFWGMWVILNCVASVVFAIYFVPMYHRNGWIPLGSLVGILVTMGGYMGLEGYLCQHLPQWQPLLRRAVKLKASYQLSYLILVPVISAMIFDVYELIFLLLLIPEAVAGLLALAFVEALSINGNTHGFIYGLLATLTTSLLMAVVIGGIAIVLRITQKIDKETCHAKN